MTAKPPQLSARRADPTGTLGLRRKFSAEMRRRFGAIVSAVRTGIVDLRVLGADDVVPPDPDAFAFRQAPGKHAAFMDWLREQMDAGVLDVREGPGRVGPEPWTNLYVRRAYGRGMEDAWLAAKREEIVPEDMDFDPDEAFRTPFHVDRAALLYTRTYEDLNGITSATSAQVGRVLAQGIAEGVNPRELARDINGRIKAIGRTRAVVLARTEVIRAHAEASLNVYEQLGVRGVRADVEWSTAGDLRVCPLCDPLDGVVMTIREARNLLPRHPQCRCAWLPSDPKDRRRAAIVGDAARERVAESRRRQGDQSLAGWGGVPDVVDD